MPNPIDPVRSSTATSIAQPDRSPVPPINTQGIEQPQGGPDEIEFFNFAKQYLGLLAGLASVPLITNGLGVISTPGGEANKNLSVAASLLSIIAFGAVFSMRQILGRTQDSRNYIVKAIPAFLVVLSLTGAGYLISAYLPQLNAVRSSPALSSTANGQLSAVVPSPESPSTNTDTSSGTAYSSAPTLQRGSPSNGGPIAQGAGQIPSFSAQSTPPAATKQPLPPSVPRLPVLVSTPPNQTATTPTATGSSPITSSLIGQYFGIQVLLVIAIGIVLITAFTMQEAHQIQNIIERDMQAERFNLLDRLRYTGDFYKLARDNSAFARIGQDLVLNLRQRDLAELATGRINALGDTARQLQERLLKQYTNTFDAVSDRDLKFWKNKELDAFSQAYDQLLATAAERGTRLTRLLLFSDSELAHWRCVAKVLRDHEERGYGWAVAPYRTIDRAVLDNEHDLDFALFDGNAAISYFRDYHSSFRHLQVTFGGFVNLPSNAKIIDFQAERYLRLSAQSWVGNSHFAQRIGGILDDGIIGAYSLDKTFPDELRNALKATTWADAQALQDDDKDRIRSRMQKFGVGPEKDSDLRTGMLIDTRTLCEGQQSLTAEDLDLVAWTILAYRRRSSTWDGPNSIDMLLITHATVTQQEETPMCTFRTSVRGISCSLIDRINARISLRVEDAHGDNVLEWSDLFQRSQYVALEDLYNLEILLPIQKPGSYVWKIAASDNSVEEHCQRKADRVCWFTVFDSSDVNSKRMGQTA